MNNFGKYTENKTELIKSMELTALKVKELEKFGIDVSESIQKIENAKKIVQSDKVSVVLVGAFSDGKTSVIAGWLNEKMDNMKISSDESSNEILCYTPSSIPDGCQIVDTPGLFGDKEEADGNGGKILWSDKTDKYISEANLILYVVTAKNPIKDSHKESIRRILKDSNKLSSTIFVINRMDDVADVTDDEDYAMQTKIKSDNLRSKLLDCGLTSLEAQNVKIACISAAPDGKGIDFWKDNREEYLKRSRLGIVENLTNEILQNSREDIITKTGCDILNDEIKKILGQVKKYEFEMENKVLPEEKETLERNEKSLKDLEKRLSRSKVEIKEELRILEKHKLSAIKAATMENLGEVLEEEIGLISGQEGYRLNDEINDIFMRYALKCNEWTYQLGNSIQIEYNKRNDFLDAIISKGGGLLNSGLKKVTPGMMKKGIFAGRDLLGKMGKTVKFKPWQATKIATKLTKALPFIGAGIDIAADVVSTVKAKKISRDFEESKKEIRESITAMFLDIYKNLSNDEKYFADFAPDYMMLREQIGNDRKAIAEQEELLKAFKAWQKGVSDADFAFC